jgi:sugar O-acyltransferase (sialic acid O-acetyltransferase NeuD family)
MKEILLIGGGGHCKAAIDIIEEEGKFQIVGIIDKPEFFGKQILGYNVIGNDSDLKNLNKKYKYALITVGQIHSATLRLKLFKKIKNDGFYCPVIISPRSYVSSHAKINEGSIIMHDVVINPDVHIGKNCIINTKALIEHDVIIGDHCHVSTGSIINGSVEIGTGSFIGSSATIVQSMKVKDNSFVRAGVVYN